MPCSIPDADVSIPLLFPLEGSSGRQHQSKSAPSRAQDPWPHITLRALSHSPLHEAKAFASAFQAASLIPSLPSPLELAEERAGQVRIQKDMIEIGFISYPTCLTPYAFLHQLQESCAPSRSLPRPILLQSQTRHQGLVVEQA